MSVSFANLPVEILHMIFIELPPGIVADCRRVCRQWRNAADSLSDTYWQGYCNNSFFYCDYNDAKLKSMLTWRELYIQFTSWSKMKTATMQTKEGQLENIAKINIVHNIVGCALDKSTKKPSLGNTIVYINLDTMQECDRISFDFLFQTNTYEENEKLIVMLKDDFKLCIVLKATKKPYIVGKVENLYSVREYTMIGNEVYFKKKKDKIIYVSTIKEEKTGEVVIKTSPLGAFEHNHDSFEEVVVAFSKIPGTAQHDVNILTDEGNMYDHKNDDFGYFNQYDRWSAKEILYDLKCNGFNWTSPHVYNWLLSTYYEYTIRMKNVKHKCMFAQGPQIIFGGDKSRKVYICNYPKTATQYIAKSFKEIDLDKLFTIKSPKKGIKQVVAVEILNGCTVVVLTAGKLFTVEFNYKSLAAQVRGGKKKVSTKASLKGLKNAEECTKTVVSTKPSDGDGKSENEESNKEAKSGPSKKIVSPKADEGIASKSSTRSGTKRVSAQKSENSLEIKRVKGKKEVSKTKKGSLVVKKPTHKYRLRSSNK